MASKRIIQTSIFLAPAAAIFLAGYGYSAGSAVSQLYNERPHHSTRIFVNIFNAGAAVAIPLALLSSASSAYLAYLCKSPSQRNLYIFAAASVISALPYTGIFMIPGINRLKEISKSEKLQDKTEQTLEAKNLLKSWVGWNTPRSLLFASGGGAALWAAIFG